MLVGHILAPLLYSTGIFKLWTTQIMFMPPALVFLKLKTTASPASKLLWDAKTPHSLLKTMRPSISVWYAASLHCPAPRQIPTIPAEGMFNGSATFLGIFYAKHNTEKYIFSQKRKKKVE